MEPVNLFELEMTDSIQYHIPLPKTIGLTEKDKYTDKKPSKKKERGKWEQEQVKQQKNSFTLKVDHAQNKEEKVVPIR